MLHRRRVEICADLREQPLALAAVIVEHANLDELVRVQVDVDLVQHGAGEAVRADGHDRVQGVSPGAKRAPRRGC